MELIIKGEKKEYSKEGLTVAELLELEKVEMPQYVSVEVNGKIVNRNMLSETRLQDGDKVEFLYFMGGGSYMDFTEQQIERYSRHIILDGVGGEGQKKIMDFSVLVVGAGGLGSPALLYLAAAGVGKIGVIDSDIVDLTNLQRQVIHFTPDVGKIKVESAKEKINLLNPEVKVNTYYERLTEKNILKIITDYDFIIDGADNFPTKFLINDACVIKKKPYSHGGILQFAGQTFTYVPGEGNCLRCVFESPPPPGEVPSCSQAGVLGAIAGILGTIQTAEALRFALNTGKLITNRILSIDVENMEFKKLIVEKNPQCLVCSDNPVITKLEPSRYVQPVC